MKHAAGREPGIKLGAVESTYVGRGEGLELDPADGRDEMNPDDALVTLVGSSPKNREDLVALRVVVRNGYSRDPADLFLDNLKRLLVRLEKQPSPVHDKSYTAFSH